MKEQSSRARYACSPELAELIKEANLLPLGRATPYFQFEIEKEIRRLKDESGGESPEISGFTFLRSLVTHLPQEFLNYIDRLAREQADPWGTQDGEETTAYRQAYVREYVAYCDRRDSMLWLVQRIHNERLQKQVVAERFGLKEPLTFEHYSSMDWEVFPIVLRTEVRRIKGILRLTGLAALIGTFDDDRLRRCVVCSNIFWAPRHNSEACRQCANKWRIQLSRTLTEEQKAERRAKREANKRIKKDHPTIGRKKK